MELKMCKYRMKSDVVACGDIIKSCYCVSKVKYFTRPCFEEICYVNFHARYVGSLDVTIPKLNIVLSYH